MMTVGGNCGNKNICFILFFFCFTQFIKHPAAITLTTITTYFQENSAREACFIIKSSVYNYVAKIGQLTLLCC